MGQSILKDLNVEEDREAEILADGRENGVNVLEELNDLQNVLKTYGV